MALLTRARWVVLPSLSEGLPVAMLEAWAQGVPTIMTAACHLPEGFNRGAALCCAADVPSIAASLMRAATMPDDTYRSHAEAAFALASDTFSRTAVARRWGVAYERALEPCA